ncbi:MAG: hypothetical protein EG822_18920 [Deltaproteobacteria bacterium]|nr:hypothetical protein [Deltaproteobacteria bacterium]TLN03296.1 MAG: hypothetical protein FDZ73_08375 [bacterium]
MGPEPGHDGADRSTGPPLGARIAGRIRNDNAVTAAQMLGKAVVETEAPSSGDIRLVWKSLGL